MSGVGDVGEGGALPVEGALEALVTHLNTHGAVVLSAPPGSGKTTRAPLALMDRLAGGLAGRWGGERVLVLQPRRVAARAVAEFMAERLGERVGERVGYQVRFERAVGPNTRVEVLTEGLLNRRMASDPELAGVGCVVLDEFHERSLQADLALATLLELRAAFRPELRLLVMSATLGEEAGALAARVGGVSLEVEGRAFPVEVTYDDQASSLDPCERAPAVIARVWRGLGGGGSVLAFFPGRREIEVARGALARLLPEAPVVALFGGQPSEAQRAALDPRGPRRVILATNIAETSLTIDGVSAVVDTGLARVSRYDARLGITQLELQPIARDSATQRAGRAGRTRAGVCYRLWTAHEHAQRPVSSEPEVRRAELTEALAHVARWAGDWRTFEWYEAPPPHHLTRAEEALTALGALTPARGCLTPLGEALAPLPLPPSLALSALFACALDGRRGGERVCQDTALLAALASADRDVLDRDLSAAHGSEAWLRVEALEDLARGHIWPELRVGAAREVQQVARQVVREAQGAWGGLTGGVQRGIEARLDEALSGGGEGARALSRPAAAALALTLGAPLSVGLRREEGGGRVLLAGGGRRS